MKFENKRPATIETNSPKPGTLTQTKEIFSPPQFYDKGTPPGSIMSVYRTIEDDSPLTADLPLGNDILKSKYEKLLKSSNNWLTQFFNMARQSIESCHDEAKIYAAFNRLQIYLGPKLYNIHMQHRESHLIRKFAKWKIQAIFELWGYVLQGVEEKHNELKKKAQQSHQTWFSSLFAYQSLHIISDAWSRHDFLTELVKNVFPTWQDTIRNDYELQQINPLAHNLIHMGNGEEKIKQLVKFPLSSQYAEFLADIQKDFYQCDCVKKFSNNGNIEEFIEEIKLQKSNCQTALSQYDVHADSDNLVDILQTAITNYKAQSIAWIEQDIKGCERILMLNAMPKYIKKNTLYLLKNKKTPTFTAYWDVNEVMHPHELKGLEQVEELNKLFQPQRVIEKTGADFNKITSLCGYKDNPYYYVNKYYNNKTAEQFVNIIIRCLKMKHLQEEDYIPPLAMLPMKTINKNLIDIALSKYNSLNHDHLKEKFFKIIELLYEYGPSHELAFARNKNGNRVEEKNPLGNLKLEWKLISLQITAITVYNEFEAAMKKTLFNYSKTIPELFESGCCRKAFYDWHGLKRGPDRLYDVQELAYALLRSSLSFNDNKLYTVFTMLQERLDTKFRVRNSDLYQTIRKQVFQPVYDKTLTYFGEMSVDRRRGIFIGASKFTKLRTEILELREANIGLSDELHSVQHENERLRAQLSAERSRRDEELDAESVMPNFKTPKKERSFRLTSTTALEPSSKQFPNPSPTISSSPRFSFTGNSTVLDSNNLVSLTMDEIILEENNEDRTPITNELDNRGPNYNRMGSIDSTEDGNGEGISPSPEMKTIDLQGLNYIISRNKTALVNNFSNRKSFDTNHEGQIIESLIRREDDPLIKSTSDMSLP